MVSIITITHNRANLIGESIRSVLAQTYTSFEYIIVDDGSEDNTEEIVKSFKDPRIQYLKLARTGKLNWLRNYGIQHSTRKYIAFIDSDDLWMEDKLELQVKRMEEDESLGFTFCETEIFNEHKILFKNIYSEKYKDNYSGGFFTPSIEDVQFFIFPSAIMIRRKCLDKTGLLDEELMCADKDLFAQLAYHFKAALIDKPLLKMRRHDSNISNHADFFTQKVLEDEIITLNKFLGKGFIGKKIFKKLCALFYYKQGEFYYHTQRFSEARKRYYNSLLNNPFQPKALAKYLISVVRK
jgi:glycosyltransferase involved in cell wall biosynthesis